LPYVEKGKGYDVMVAISFEVGGEGFRAHQSYLWKRGQVGEPVQGWPS